MATTDNDPGGAPMRVGGAGSPSAWSTARPDATGGGTIDQTSTDKQASEVDGTAAATGIAAQQADSYAREQSDPASIEGLVDSARRVEEPLQLDESELARTSTLEQGRQDPRVDDFAARVLQGDGVGGRSGGEDSLFQKMMEQVDDSDFLHPLQSLAKSGGG